MDLEYIMCLDYSKLGWDVAARSVMGSPWGWVKRERDIPSQPTPDPAIK